MSFVIPSFSRKKVSKAGNILLSAHPDSKEFTEAFELLNHWRACHAYPINTFQATLRQRLKKIIFLMLSSRKDLNVLHQFLVSYKEILECKWQECKILED